MMVYLPSACMPKLDSIKYTPKDIGQGGMSPVQKAGMPNSCCVLIALPELWLSD